MLNSQSHFWRKGTNAQQKCYANHYSSGKSLACLPYSAVFRQIYNDLKRVRNTQENPDEGYFLTLAIMKKNHLYTYVRKILCKYLRDLVFMCYFPEQK